MFCIGWTFLDTFKHWPVYHYSFLKSMNFLHSFKTSSFFPLDVLLVQYTLLYNNSCNCNLLYFNSSLILDLYHLLLIVVMRWRHFSVCCIFNISCQLFNFLFYISDFSFNEWESTNWKIKIHVAKSTFLNPFVFELPNKLFLKYKSLNII